MQAAGIFELLEKVVFCAIASAIFVSVQIKLLEYVVVLLVLLYVHVFSSGSSCYLTNRETKHFCTYACICRSVIDMYVCMYIINLTCSQLKCAIYVYTCQRVEGKGI